MMWNCWVLQRQWECFESSKSLCKVIWLIIINNNKHILRHSVIGPPNTPHTHTSALPYSATEIPCFGESESYSQLSPITKAHNLSFSSALHQPIPGTHCKIFRASPESKSQLSYIYILRQSIYPWVPPFPWGQEDRHWDRKISHTQREPSHTLHVFPNSA